MANTEMTNTEAASEIARSNPNATDLRRSTPDPLARDAIPGSRRRYPSDVSDRTWQRIEPLLPQNRLRGRRRRTELREVVNGIQYRWTTGCAWRMLPHDFPPWATIYAYFQRWFRCGVLPRLRESLLRPQRQDVPVEKCAGPTDETPKSGNEFDSRAA